jgi:hypothetical protein
MMDHLLRKGRGWRRAAQCAAALLAVASSGAVGGCLNRPLERNEPRTTSTIVEPVTQSAVDKIDLLLMIDNSRSMADKQLILADAVPDLVRGLVNPKCIDPNTGTVAPTQPPDPLTDCAMGFKREFEPVLNIHIGIITSSLGGHGADACPIQNDSTCPSGLNPSNNDAGHLVSRKDACLADTPVPTYSNKGFLAWDPNGELVPPGEKNIGDVSMPAGGGIVPTLREMVIGTGQIGCGYEAQHESWYRFLVDPEPYKEITIQDGKAVGTGTDEVIVGDATQMLLGQRKDFLRPSSLVAVIMLTDENDCSIKESGTSFLAAQQRDPKDTKKIYRLPRPRTECSTIGPNDPCCKSCGSPVGDCAADPTCGPPLTAAEDDLNLRCFDQKRRFGFDFLYPIDRYTNALTQAKVPKRDGTLVDNPLFIDLNPDDEDSNIRNRGLVFIAGIVGVPWQLIARQDAAGTPDLVNGLNFEKEPIGGFKTFEELSIADPAGLSTWDKILGDPVNFVPPTDPHMVESIKVRDPLSTTAADPYNGHEYTIANNGDLQYACIFDLPEKRDCSTGLLSCDCDTMAAPDNPLCDPAKKTDQIKAKSYPGLRELALLKSVGPQGIVASVCPAQLTNTDAADYGYRPAIGAIIDRLKAALKGKCLPRELAPDANGQVQCLIIEARATGGACECDPAKARGPIQPAHEAAVKAAKADKQANTAWDCFCEIAQTGADPDLSSKEELDACQQDASPAPVIKGGPQDGQPANGWCYVDAVSTPPTGNPAIVKDCPANEKRLVRFVGAGNALPNATLFITCSGA